MKSYGVTVYIIKTVTSSAVLSHDAVCLVCSSNVGVCGRNLVMKPSSAASSRSLSVLSHCTIYLACSSNV